MNKKGILVDFAGETKTTDWRCATHKVLKQSEKEKEVINWIGILSLREVKEGKRNYNLYFVTKNGGLAIDQEEGHCANGVSSQRVTPIEYEFNNEIVEVMLDAQKEKSTYFHFLIEETVFADGSHTVDIFDRRKYMSVFRYGIPGIRLWKQPYNEEIEGDTGDVWKDGPRAMIPAEPDRIRILTQGKL